MCERERIMEAALQWICDQPALIGNYAEQNRARDALVEVRALPASNTETLAADNMRLVIEKQAAEARLAQIWGEAAAVKQGADELARILFARDGYAHAMSI